MAMSMRSASARPGTRSRSISASATSCISSPTFSVRAAEKVLAVRQVWADKHPDVVAALVRAAVKGAEFIENPANLSEAARILAQPERIGVDAEVIQRTLTGRLKISPDGTLRESGRYLLVGREGAGRPDPVQAAWLYAQMVRWGQTALTPDGVKTAMAVFRPDLYDAALGRRHRPLKPPRRSGHSRARPSIPATSGGIWRPSRSDAGRPDSVLHRFWAEEIIG